MDTDHTGPDYPAAHSMDTEWYAIDRDDHVAIFHTGEEGALPDDAANHNTLPRPLLDAIPDVPYQLIDWLGDDRQEHHVELPPRTRKEGLGKVFLFLCSIDAVRDQVNGYSVEQGPAGEGVAVLFEDLPSETAWMLHESGACLGCFPWISEYRYYRLYDDRAGRVGLFNYKNDGRGLGASCPYLRGRPPFRPLKVDQLPRDLRYLIGQLEFQDLRFSETAKIQPAGIVDCQAQNDAYLDLDGVTIRSALGAEGVFDPSLFAGFHDYRVEVPPSRPKRPRRRRRH
jgi:hypothetical protein